MKWGSSERSEESKDQMKSEQFSFRIRIFNLDFSWKAWWTIFKAVVCQNELYSSHSRKGKFFFIFLVKNSMYRVNFVESLFLNNFYNVDLFLQSISWLCSRQFRQKNSLCFRNISKITSPTEFTQWTGIQKHEVRRVDIFLISGRKVKNKYNCIGN